MTTFTPTSWEWPTDLPPGGFPEYEDSQETQPQSADQQPSQAGPPRPERHYRPRTCRICLEVVQPTFHPPSEAIPNILQSPRVTYESEDLGRLIRPCKCKGSSKWVHSGCLSQWRLADPASKRNFWQCPTCGFNYRLERMRWGRWISSAFTQIVLTVSILFLTVFILGFLGDPIINLYLDPYDTIRSSQLWRTSRIERPFFDEEDETSSWAEHIVKGVASLGLLSFLKVFVALNPWQWWHMRNSGFMSGGTRGGTTGRDRVASISWIVIVVGVATFFWTVYKGVRVFSRRTLERAGERVMDVTQGDDDEDEDEQAGEQESSARSTASTQAEFGSSETKKEI